MATFHATFPDRAVIGLEGPDWRSFLQVLLTQDVASLAPGEIRFGALLSPQGRLLFDLFILGDETGCRLDCAADRRDALIDQLSLYRLRAKVTFTPLNASVGALWGGSAAPPGWLADPRLAALGFRGYGLAAPSGAVEGDYEAHRLSLGVPGSADWDVDRTYPIEADFDLLGGVDFRKGCFVGQETTSRMKRRGAIRTRMVPIAFEGPAVPAGSELLAGGLRAGVTASSMPGRAMASVRLDRIQADDRVLPDGRVWRPDLPGWMSGSATGA